MENKDFTFVIYSHSDYVDVLRVQNSYMKKIQAKKLLFIDKIVNNEDGEIYDGVYFYNDKINYTKRVLQCLQQANIVTKYIIFIHDVDILIYADESLLSNTIKIMDQYSLDRVDLKCIPNQELDNYNLIDSTGNYVFNVNPSLWKLSSYLDLLSQYDCDYRSVEHSVQDYCKQKCKIKIFTGKDIKAGYYEVLPFFTFLHLSHYGGLLPKDNSINELPSSLKDEYDKIIETFPFKRPFRLTMH